MKKKTYRTAVSVLLAAGLCAGLLAGCGNRGGGGAAPGAGAESQSGGTESGSGLTGSGSGSEGTGSGRPGAGDGQEPSAAPGSVLSPGDVSAKGRYVETEIPLPEEAEGLSFLSFYEKDGKPELYMYAGDGEKITEVNRYILNGENWETDEAWSARIAGELAAGEIDAGSGIRQVFRGQDGNDYVTTLDGDYVCHLYRLGEDGHAQDLIHEAFLPPAGKDYGMIPGKADVTEDGNILLYDINEVHCFRPDGSRLFTVEKFGAGTSDYSAGYVEDNQLVVRVDEGVRRYSLDDGAVLETVPHDELKNDMWDECVLFGDGNGGIYVADRAGLSHVSRGGTLWEMVIDGSLCSMGMENLYFHHFVPGKEQDYYAVFRAGSGGAPKLCHYTYDPDMASIPPETLTVYSLKDSPTARQAAAMMQQADPDVRVEVRCGADAEGNVTEETVKALNTELLNGKGADVLILDGLPVESYIEKGVLLDMRDTVSRIQEENPVLPQIVSAYTQEDGSVFCLPARMSAAIVLGTPQAADAFASMDSMRNYAGNHPLLPVDNYENLLRLLAACFSDELFGQKDSPDAQTLQTYLETVKTLGEANGSRTAFTEEELNTTIAGNDSYNQGFSNKYFAYDMELSDCAPMVLDTFHDLSCPAAVQEKKPGSVITSLKGIYFPSVLAGINRSVRSPELAETYIRCLFSLDLQKENLYDGFPVGEKALDIQRQEESDLSLAMSLPNMDYMINAPYPDREQRDRLFELLTQVSVPYSEDETVLDMVVDGSKDYLEGKASVDQAANAILQQILLYRAEQS